ncbi:hypothetical protein V9T40_008926 [Parthenolecanium corni]|uniref:Uncharacterized protein n=1 Tax=Parthenolecanium corni TaxID=536013 RepID=A0AAN9TLS8_9HEMI
MVIDGKNADVALRQISLFAPHILRLEFSNIDSNIILQFFQRPDKFPNLKTLSITWKWASLSPDCIFSTTSLSGILDQCPKLDQFHLENCFLYENTSHLVEKISSKRIRRLSILNNYQFLDEVDRFYELKNMNELRISSCGSADAVQRVCQTNRESLTSLEAHIDAWTSSAQTVKALRSIGACSQLVRLHIGVSVRDTEAWTGLANLPKLRFFSIEVDRMPTKAFVSLFSCSFVGQLHSLKVQWNRRVDLEELRCLERLQLRQLSLGFVEDISDEERSSVLDIVVDLVKKNSLLRRLKIETYFYNVNFLGCLYGATTMELRYIKIRQIFDSLNQNSVHYSLQQVRNFISFTHSLEYTMSESVLEIVIRRKMQ